MRSMSAGFDFLTLTLRRMEPLFPLRVIPWPLGRRSYPTSLEIHHAGRCRTPTQPMIDFPGRLLIDKHTSDLRVQRDLGRLVC